MNEHRHLPVGRGREQPPELFVSSTRRIANPESEPQAALVELAPHQRREATQLVLRRRLVQIRIGCTAPAERERALAGGLRDHLAKRVPPGTLVAHRGPEVDQGPPLASHIPGVDGIDADLQLHRRRHSVSCLVPAALGVLPMGVQVDEPGRHDETASIEHLTRLGGVLGDGHDHAVPDRDVPDSIETAVRIHDPAADDQQVDRL